MSWSFPNDLKLDLDLDWDESEKKTDPMGSGILGAEKPLGKNTPCYFCDKYVAVKRLRSGQPICKECFDYHLG